MAVIRIVETSVGTAAGTNLMLSGATGGQLFVFDHRPRRIRRIAVVGSTGAGVVSVYIGTTLVGDFASTTTAANASPKEAADFVPVPGVGLVAPGEMLSVQVKAISVTNPFIVVIETEE
jgi:hypothetical protein